MSGFRGPYSTPTDEQAALVGHIVSDWAIVDASLAGLASRLALAPDYPARSLTDGLSGSRLELTVLNLIAMHSVRYNNRIVSKCLSLKIRAAIKRVKRLRVRRNEFAHSIGLRMSDDDLALVDLRGWGTAKVSSRVSLAALRELKGKTLRLGADLELLVGAIPKVREDFAMNLAAAAAADMSSASGE